MLERATSTASNRRICSEQFYYAYTLFINNFQLTIYMYIYREKYAKAENEERIGRNNSCEILISERNIVIEVSRKENPFLYNKRIF